MGCATILGPVSDATDATDPSPVVAVAHKSVPRTASALAAGERLGDHHTIIRLLGAGGMGEVYLARDEKLAREVAVKLVHPALARAGEGWRDRLIREAQAMAQLNHANIVAVHEVGTIGDEVFVAMEYVAGPSLRAWLPGKSWREIVRAFAGCAAGLAAAHAAGISHGDFKPDNVLVGSDGRVRVTDFGLARAGDDDSGPRGGTPAYMAPELRAGGVATPASDQYALCIALRDALADADGVVQPAWLRPVLARGRADDPAARWPSLDALITELGRDPARRRRQLLLTAVASSAVACAAIIGFAGGRVVPKPCDNLARKLAGAWDPALRATAADKFHATALPYADLAFTNAAEQLDRYATAWVAMRHEACTATAVSHEQSDAVLDLRMQCLDRRRDELASVSELLAAAGKQVVEHAAETVRGLPAIADCADAASLSAVVPPPPDQRAPVAALRRRVAAAATGVRAGAYAEARRTAEAASTEARTLGYAPLIAEALIAQGEAATGAGDAAAGDAAFREAVPAAARGRDDRTAAVAAVGLYHVVGAIEQKFPEALALEPGAIAAVARVGDPPALRAKLLLHIGELANRRAKLDEAKAALDAAIAIDRAPGGDPLELARALGARAAVARDAGDLPGARTAYAEALALLRAQLGPDHPLVATLLSSVAHVTQMAGDLDEAQHELEQALAIGERALGKDHIDVARILNSLGMLLAQRDKLDEAHAALMRSLAIKRAVLGDDHRDVGNTYLNLAAVAYQRNDFVEAREDNVHAIAIYEAKLGPDHPRVASTLYNLANIDQLSGRYADARAGYQRAVAIYKRAQGDPSDLADALTQLAATDLADGKLADAAADAKQAIGARAEMHDDKSEGFATALDIAASIADARGDHATALANCTRTLALLEAAAGPKSPLLAEPLLCLGQAQLGLAHGKEAIAPLERARAVWSADQDAQIRAEIDVALAHALWDGGGDRARAHGLAVAAIAALDPLAAVRPPLAKARDEARAWLASH